MQLTGSLCSLRPWHPRDADALVKYANNVNIARHLRDRFPHPYTLRDAKAFIHSCAAVRPHVSFAIVIDGEAAGGIGISSGSDIERFSAEIGYWLGEPFWGRGIVTEALVAVTRYALDSCRLTRIYALPFATNTGSCRVLEKAGYTLEARLRRSAIKDGQVVDQLQYSFIAEAL